MRLIAVISGVLLWVFWPVARNDAHAADSVTTPILVELFTSEGCSSCPPVDAWAQRIDASQPIPGGQVIVLSEHVDYWNAGGWKDPYSSPSITDRQNAYCRVLRISEPYTPQVIVNGSAELRLTDPKQVSEVFTKAVAAPQVHLQIVSVEVEAGGQPILKTRIEADNSSEAHEADVYVAIALDHAESQILRGENSGRHLTHVAVVQSLKKIGRLEKGKKFSQDLQVKLKPGADPTNLRIVAFVQEPGVGTVMGATLEKAPFKVVSAN